MRRIQIETLLERHSAILGLTSVITLATYINKNFLTPENLTNVLRQASMNGMIAVGMTMVVICGSIDPSARTTTGLCGYITLYFSNYSLIPAVIVPLLTGIIVGIINGFLIDKVKIAPFIATLAAMITAKGTTLILTSENTYFASSSIEQPQHIRRGLLTLCATAPSVMSICCTVAGAYILKYTMPGRNMYAVGGNTEVARMMGVDVEETPTFSHISIGEMAVLVGTTLVSRVGAAYSLAGEGKELDIIAARVIGGIALTGGKSHISDTFIGALIMGMLTSIFGMRSLLNPFQEKVIIGILALIVVLIQSASESGMTLGKSIKTLVKGKM